ncbi:MAG: 1-(5-phosphoribosyl)-5-[(5-phosphoribosylamino)methylideneamino]imidazole-4-carboxamide isomerase [Anaerolineaceae bacterium]|nr:MAG: 1-(5-phosphoribosyl)-5-[(5-phosphoribosylamino)methylideneamino]imidazole-4-carboxamide isomerase [Anaerolineaceae bacterium]
MIVYPAIDLRSGKVVRLLEGDPARQTTFSDDPVQMATNWIEQGAEWLHVVNLDGAFNAQNDNLDVLKRIAALGVRVQFGGGLRDMAQIGAAFSAGASRVILGTIAAQQPPIIKEAVEAFGAERICIGLDARGGKITTHGWQQTTDMTPTEFGQVVAEYGAQHALYTDVARDGGLGGVDVAGTAEIATQTGLHVIASGGVRDLDDVRQAKQAGNIAGIIIGMALYTGKIDLREAIKLSDGAN